LLPILNSGRVELLDHPPADRSTLHLLRDAHTDIPAVVEAMRQYWMPIRYARKSAPQIATITP
jgi:uncharacterized protein